MKKLFLLVALVGGLGLFASTKTAEAGPGYGGGYNTGFSGGYQGGNNTYRYWNNSYRGSVGYRTNFGGYPRTTYGGLNPGFVPSYPPVYRGCNH